MKNNLFKGVALLGGLLLASLLPMHGATAVYTDYTGTPEWWGTRKAETYNIGTFLSGERFAGFTLNQLSFPVSSTEGVGDYSVWVATNLDIVDGVFTPNVINKEVAVVDGKATLTLDAPCEIGRDGIYIGYTFNVEKRETDEQMNPVPIIKDSADPYGHGIYVLCSRTFSKWNTAAGGEGTIVPFEITVGGVGANALSFELPAEVNAAVGKWVELPVTLYNYGVEPVNSLELTYTYSDGNTQKKSFTLDSPLENSFLASVDVKLPLTALKEKGHDEVSVSISGVNGKPNEYDSPVLNKGIDVWSYLPVRRPLLEEYTATDCGFCPRGALGLEMLAEKYGDLMVGVSYHSNDVMAVINVEDFPNPAPAQPTLWIDRMRETDPYFGDRIKNMEFGAPEVWEEMQSRFSPVDIVFDCDWENIMTDRLTVSGDITFVAPVSNQGLKVVYLVVADGLSKMDAAWVQGNFYSGQKGIWPEDFDVYVNATNPIIGMEYNDVVILTITEDLTDALMSEINADEVFGISREINLQDAKSIKGELLLQDREKLRVVVAIYDSVKGEVLNCNQVRYGASSVKTLPAAGDVNSVSYYNLQGIQLSAPVDGEVTVEVSRNSDGSTTVRKLLSPRK